MLFLSSVCWNKFRLNAILPNDRRLWQRLKLRPPKSETSLAETNTYCHRLSSGQKLLVTWQKRVWRSNLCGRYHKILSSKVSVKYWQNKWGIRISNYVVSPPIVFFFPSLLPPPSNSPCSGHMLGVTCWTSRCSKRFCRRLVRSKSLE